MKTVAYLRVSTRSQDLANRELIPCLFQPQIAGEASMKSYWLRWASSAITTMLRRFDRRGCRSPFSSGKNFWMVVNTTPPDETERLIRRTARFSA